MLLALAACGKKPDEKVEREPPRPAGMVLLETDIASLAGWNEDAVAEALPALLKSCRALMAQPAERPVGPRGLAGTVADWREPCAALDSLAPEDDAALRSVLRSNFVPFAVTDAGADQGLFTGYYEAELRAAAAPIDGFRWPLYKRPEDLVRVNLGRFRADLEGEQIYGRVRGGALVPYHSRQEIDGGALDDRDLELLWVDDPVDSFFLHIQGSGRARLPDGSTIRVGFAGTNGLPFTGIGRVLLDEGLIPRDRASMQSIRDWLRANPDKAREMMQRNARYIFFRTIDGEGPIGSQGVALTAGRSLAIDPALLPLGAPIWLDTTWPGEDRPLRRLMVAQDTGGAIKGPVRGDVFWGTGEAALEVAGGMKETGRYYLFLPAAVAERRRTTS